MPNVAEQSNRIRSRRENSTRRANKLDNDSNTTSRSDTCSVPLTEIMIYYDAKTYTTYTSPYTVFQNYRAFASGLRIPRRRSNSLRQVSTHGGDLITRIFRTVRRWRGREISKSSNLRELPSAENKAESRRALGLQTRFVLISERISRQRVFNFCLDPARKDICSCSERVKIYRPTKSSEVAKSEGRKFFV